MPKPSPVVDLDAYFARIGYRKSSAILAPTLDTLNDIVRGHVEAIPFENLDVLLGRPIDLSPHAIEHKLVYQGRGGYCFEQNRLLQLVLESIGFEAKPLSARGRYQRPRDTITPRTHLFLRVEIDGESWLVDAGFGGLSPTSAIRLDATGEQMTPHEPRRIVREGALSFHQARLDDTWHDLYEFTLEEMPPIDQEIANWFTSAHPMSHFKDRLTVARALPDGGRKTLLNRQLTVRRRGAEPAVVTLESPEQLLTVLAKEFSLHFTKGTEFSCSALDW